MHAPGIREEKALEPSGALANYVGEYYSENPWFGTVEWCNGSSSYGWTARIH